MASHGSVVLARGRWFVLAVALGVLGALLVGLAPPAQAASIVVTTLADGAPANDSSCTLREAILNANANDQSGSTDCAAGSGADEVTFAVTGAIYLTAELPNVSAAGGALTVRGPGASLLTISGDTNNDDTTTANVRVITVLSGASLDLFGISIAEGGDGIVDGGGVFNDGGVLTVASSTFAGNDAPSGGGVYNDGGTVTVTNSTFSGNTAASGGGIVDNGGSVTITDSTFSGNSAGPAGGGVLESGGALTITSSTFAGNNAQSGGGVYNAGILTVTNSTFAGNTATFDGGGVYNAGTLTAAFSTFASNGALNAGGGIRNVLTAVAMSSIVANSPSGGDCSGGITDGGYNLSSDSSCGFSGTSLSNTDPLLEPLDDNGGPTETMALPESGPAVDVIPEGFGGGCGTTVEVDQRGFVRPEEDLCEIGAFEVQDPTPQPPPVVVPPEATSMSPTSGPVGTVVTIVGNNLAYATVRFNGIVAPVQINSLTQVVVAVPPGATTGPVTVATSGGSVSPGTFTVTPPAGPTVTGFAPSQGRVGTTVVITGAGFAGTSVTFDGVPAPFVVDSPTQITAVVPPHAGAGPIVVTTGLGFGTTAGDFVVVHPRSVGLFLPWAMGSVSVTDGWSGCAAGVPVRLLRSSGGGFVTAASGTTTGHGAYRFYGIHGSGSYRAVAKRVTLPSGDVCLRATSRVAVL